MCARFLSFGKAAHDVKIFPPFGAVARVSWPNDLLQRRERGAATKAESQPPKFTPRPFRSRQQAHCSGSLLSFSPDKKKTCLQCEKPERPASGDRKAGRNPSLSFGNPFSRPAFWVACKQIVRNIRHIFGTSLGTSSFLLCSMISFISSILKHSFLL